MRVIKKAKQLIYINRDLISNMPAVALQGNELHFIIYREEFAPKDNVLYDPKKYQPSNVMATLIKHVYLHNRQEVNLVCCKQIKIFEFQSALHTTV